MTTRNDRYDELTYSGVVNRIADGVPLSPHQKKVMAECGLTEADMSRLCPRCHRLKHLPNCPAKRSGKKK